jgi:hypothetical protein
MRNSENLPRDPGHFGRPELTKAKSGRPELDDVEALPERWGVEADAASKCKSGAAVSESKRMPRSRLLSW